jgi:putative serine protease PepD
LGSEVESGAYIGSIVEGSPAAQAGLKEGDIVTKLDNTNIYSAAELMIGVRGHLVGDKVTIEYQRDGKTNTVEVTLGSDKSSQ